MATQIGSYDFRAANQARQSIEVGGRNYALGTGTALEAANSFVGYDISPDYNLLSPEDTVTISFDVKSTQSQWIDVYYRTAPAGGTAYASTGTNPYPSHQILEADAWYHVVYTGPAGGNVADAKFIAIRSNASEHASGTVQGTVTVKNFMLEKGTIASSWKPAEEDTEANILASGVEYIVGTQAAATNLWTGVTKEAALVAGKTIAYKLPYAGNSSAATLNLTLSGGGTTGAKGVRWNTNNAPNNTVTTHFGAGSVINMTYDGEYWRVAAQYHTDTTWQTRNNGAVKAETAITASRIIVGTDAGYKNLAAGVTFDLAHPPLYAGSAISAGSTGTNNFLQINITATNNGTITSGAAYKTLYLVGTISGSTFTVAASPFMTTVPPITEDNKVYMPLGVMTTATAVYFDSPKILYAFIDGKFRQVTPTEIVATHRIYYRTATANVNLAAPQTWVSEANGNVYDAWTTKVPPLSAKNGIASTDEDATKYLYLYTCEQRKRLDGTTECTKVLLDENTTVIDGGQIVTNSIAANSIQSEAIEARHIKSGAITVMTVDGLSDELDGLQSGIDGHSKLIRTVNIGGNVQGVETALLDDNGQYVGYRTVQSANGSDIYEPTSNDSVAHYGASSRIGKTSGLHIETRPDRMSFLSSGVSLPDISTAMDPDQAIPGEVAYLATSEDELGNVESTFYIVHSVVVRDLRFGNWKWWNRPNNNMTLKWIGDDQ